MAATVRGAEGDGRRRPRRAPGRSRAVASGAMKLLAVCQADEPGGAELGLLRLVRRLAARGWDVTLTTPAGGALARSGFAWLPLDVGGVGAGGGARAAAAWPPGRGLGRKCDVMYLHRA